LGVLDRGGVALDADPKLKAKVERFFVCQSQLAGKLVDADLLRQLAVRSSLGDAPRALQRRGRLPILAHRPRQRGTTAAKVTRYRFIS